jgi:hypothetical protein
MWSSSYQHFRGTLVTIYKTTGHNLVKYKLDIVVFTCGLFNNAVSSSEYTVLNEKVISEQ